ncbi:MAG: porin family protein [Bacteroidota bacterium]
MKTTLSYIGLCMALLAAQTSFAQFSLGARGGVHFSTIDLPVLDQLDLINFKPALNTSIALVGEYKVTPNFSIQPELAYTRKGFVIKESFKIGGENIPLPIGIRSDFRLNYVEMPLLFKYTFGERKVRAYVTAGPSMGYATSGRFKTRASILVDIPINNTKFDLDNLDFNRWEVSGTVGAGMSIAAGKGELFMDARYTHGFTDVNQLPLVDLNAQNRGVGVNLGYLIPIGGGGDVYP